MICTDFQDIDFYSYVVKLSEPEATIQFLSVPRDF